MLSALIMIPFILFANMIAILDLPEAVGPAMRINFFDNLNLFLLRGIFLRY